MTAQPCSTCRAPLAADQRFCVYCGTRRPESRMEFLDILAGGQETSLVAAPAEPVAPPRLAAGLLPLVAVVLGALALGALLGHWATDRNGTGATPATQVIRLTGAGAAAPAATADPAATAAAATSSSKAKKGASAKKAAAAPKNAVSVGSLKSKKAVENAVKKKQPISTGDGTLPPTDNKPAGGGSGFETIG